MHGGAQPFAILLFFISESAVIIIIIANAWGAGNATRRPRASSDSPASRTVLIGGTDGAKCEIAFNFELRRGLNI